jgi:hypothetical protein
MEVKMKRKKLDNSEDYKEYRQQKKMLKIT